MSTLLSRAANPFWRVESFLAAMTSPLFELGDPFVWYHAAYHTCSAGLVVLERTVVDRQLLISYSGDMASRQEARRSLEAGYVTRTLRVGVSRVISDEIRGSGYAVVLGEQEAPIELVVYPEMKGVTLNGPGFTFELTGVGDVRRRGRQLRFAAQSGPRMVGVAVSKSGDVDVRYRDQTRRISPWEQNVLTWDDAQG
jgi:hypothetical protein